MSATATATTVSVDREALIGLLVEIQTVCWIFDKIAGCSDGPLLGDLDSMGFELYCRTFGDPTRNASDSGYVGLWADIETRAREAGVAFMRPESGAS